MDLAVLDELESQHRAAEQLLKRLERAEEPDEQRPLVDELLAAMARHMEIEESEVYPELAKLDGEMAEEAEIEHSLARKGLQQLDEMVGKPGFGAAVAMVRAGIAHHVEEEEQEAFPKMRSELGATSGATGDATRDELYEQAKEAGIEGRSHMTKDQLAAALKRSA